ncbi:hypothetical protein [Streptomyces sp. NBC_01373]|nr:hypothetical protein [Streptomyces sp. NBC_01373]MCX4707080.1 hypothetical protein [Streptomyces sp. NBC_01373]
MVTPEPTPDVLPMPTEPRQHDWDDDPRTCALEDRRYWNRDED